MKLLLLFMTIMLHKNTEGQTANPYKYESRVLTFKLLPGKDDNYILIGGSGIKSKETERRTGWGGVSMEIDLICKEQNSAGFHLEGFTSTSLNDNIHYYSMIFEKSSSYKEEELKKLVDELTEKINTTSKKYSDSILVVLQTNVLNYLKSIPNDIITKEYKENLTSFILNNAEEKIKVLLEQIKKEIRNVSN